MDRWTFVPIQRRPPRSGRRHRRLAAWKTTTLGAMLGTGLLAAIAALVAGGPRETVADDSTYGLESALPADTLITMAVKSALSADPALSGLTASVATHDGVVTLEGQAPTGTAKARAATLASRQKGVQAVENRLLAPTS